MHVERRFTRLRYQVLEALDKNDLGHLTMIYSPSLDLSFLSANTKPGLILVTKEQEAHRTMLELFVKFSYLFWIGNAPSERFKIFENGLTFISMSGMLSSLGIPLLYMEGAAALKAVVLPSMEKLFNSNPNFRFVLSLNEANKGSVYEIVCLFGRFCSRCSRLS